MLALVGCTREEWVEGRVEVTQVNVAAKYPGRIAKLHVNEGDTVEIGQPLVQIDSPEALAKRDEADALITAAKAMQSKAEQGARQQEVQQAQAAAAAARSQEKLAELTFARMGRLFDKGVIPRQRLDEAGAAREAAHQARIAADALYSMAREGVREQDLQLASAGLSGAEGKRREVQAALAETELKSTVKGEVVQKLLHEGEIVAAGYPILIIARTDDPWVTFNLREDRLRGVRIGDSLLARIPALGDATVQLRVDYVAPLGDFATWRSTRDLGSFDLRTFEIRARPMTAPDGLRPGMSALVEASAFGRREKS
ncbi:MAG: HlyD family secretion protein [Steroidobacteraceae bacterium]